MSANHQNGRLPVSTALRDSELSCRRLFLETDIANLDWTLVGINFGSRLKTLLLERDSRAMGVRYKQIPECIQSQADRYLLWRPPSKHGIGEIAYFGER